MSTADSPATPASTHVETQDTKNAEAEAKKKQGGAVAAEGSASVKDDSAKKKKNSEAAEKPAIDLSKLPIRSYLDKTVVPVLLRGLAALVKERPENPLQYLADFLLSQNAEKS